MLRLLPSICRTKATYMKDGLQDALRMGSPLRIRFGTPRARGQWCTALLRTP